MVSAAVLDAMSKLVGAQATLEPYEHLDPGFLANDALQDALEGVVKNDALLKKHGFAVVDLTDSPLAPAYAGWNDTNQKFVGSLAKLLPIFAAYTLRADLQSMSRRFNITSLPTLADEARREYQRRGAATATRPWIEKIFTLGAPGEVEFTQLDISDHLLHARDGGTAHDMGDSVKLQAKLTDTPFRERLRLVAGWSDNASSAVVIQALGFPYLWSLATRAGFFRWNWDAITRLDIHGSSPGGLFLASDYQYSVWNRPSNVWIGESSQQASARSAAGMLTLLAQNSLFIDPKRDAHAGMREILRKTKDDFTSGLNNSDPAFRGTDSFLGKGMNNAGWTAAQEGWDLNPLSLPAIDPQEPLAVSKIGSDVKCICDALLVRTRQTGGALRAAPLTAVLVALADGLNDIQILHKFGEGMAHALHALHP